MTSLQYHFWLITSAAMSLIFEAIACCCWFKMYAIDISDMIFLLWLAKIRMSSYLLMVASPLNQQTIILDGLNPSFWWLTLHFASCNSNCWWNLPPFLGNFPINLSHFQCPKFWWTLCGRKTSISWSPWAWVVSVKSFVRSASRTMDSGGD